MSNAGEASVTPRTTSHSLTTLCQVLATTVTFSLILASHRANAIDLDENGNEPRVAANVSDVQRKIDARQRALPSVPPYLYSTDTVTDSIATVWMDLTGRLLRTDDLRSKYDEFYAAALDYRTMAGSALSHAARLAKDGNEAGADTSLQEAYRYLKLFSLAEKGAVEAYRGNVDATATLAHGIYQGSKASAKYGAAFVPGPWTSRAVDAVFMATDLLVDSSELGLAEGKRRAVAAAIVKVALDEVPIPALEGKTFSAALRTNTSSALFPLLNDIFGSSVFERAAITAIEVSGAHVTSQALKLAIKNVELVTLGGASLPRPQEPKMGGGGVQAQGFTSQPSYAGDCGRRSAQSVCLGFGDGYIWLVEDALVRWETDEKILTGIGHKARYSHVLGTSLVRREPIGGGSQLPSATPSKQQQTDTAPPTSPDTSSSHGLSEYVQLPHQNDRVLLEEIEPSTGAKIGLNIRGHDSIDYIRTDNQGKRHTAKCGNVVGGEPTAYAIVPRSIDFADDVRMRGIVNAVGAYYLRRCVVFTDDGAKNFAFVNVLVCHDGANLAEKITHDRECAVRGQWGMTQGRPPWHLASYNNSVVQAEAQRRLANTAAATKRFEAQRQAEKRQVFFRQHDIAQEVDAEELNKNPFAFEGKIVALRLRFARMEEKDVAIFDNGREMEGLVVASGTPTSRFGARSGHVIMVGRVQGTRKLSVPILGQMPAAQVEFITALDCAESSCADILPDAPDPTNNGASNLTAADISGTWECRLDDFTLIAIEITQQLAWTWTLTATSDPDPGSPPLVTTTFTGKRTLLSADTIELAFDSGGNYLVLRMGADRLGMTDTSGKTFTKR